jgi:hypothetical protein
MAGSPFAVQLSLRPPAGRDASAVSLLKGIFDGVVCALQAHGDRAGAAELAERVARNCGGEAGEVQALLLDRERAVLGTVPRLLHLRGEGVAWAPADDLCLAGQLLLKHPGGDAWTLSGRVFEILGSEES